ncbi:reverse transcriptase domain-containing protein [Tanacetum coccineum]
MDDTPNQLYDDVDINLNPLIDVMAGMPNYGKFLKELISNKHKIEQIFAAFLSDESSVMIQNKVPPKLGDPESFLIPCNFNKTFSCNALADLGASINLMPYSLYAKLSLETLKPTKMSVRLADRSFQYPVGIAKNMLVEVGKFIFPADFVILKMEEDNFDALLNEGSKILHFIEGTLLEEEIFAEFDEFMAMTTDENSDSESDTEDPPFKIITINTDYKIKTSLEEPPMDLKLKPLPDNLEYVFLEEPSFLHVIISSQLSKEKKNKLISVLKKHKQAFAWKTTDIPGICPSFYKHKIQLLDDKKPVVRKQRRLNPNMQEVVKKEIMKLLDTGIIYPIADSPWVSPIHRVPKKGGITVVTNENDKLVPTRTITGWRNDWRMPFGLCNAPATFQRCMLAIFHDMIEESVEVFMDDFFVFRNSFDTCLNNLDKMLKCCKEAHLVLNGEKCHFMVKEGIVLGHKVSSTGLEVDKAKIDVISKLPPPTNIKGVRSFLGHTSFYRRFIKVFSKIARPLTKLLEKDNSFEFDGECQKAFESLKEKLTCAPVIVSPNWNLPFELMCDASDFSVGAVLGQKDGKNFYPIYFASKTLNSTQQKYTVTEKELMAVVFAFDKFRSYLILSKTIVHTDHSALRNLFKKQDAKPRLIRWILLLQEFDIEIKDKKGTKNIAADHFSRIKNDEISDDSEVDDNFPEETLMEININEPVFADFTNNLSEPYLYKVCSDVAIDYVSKWAEAQALPTNDGRVVVAFLKKLFCRFGMPKALISDRVVKLKTRTELLKEFLKKTVKDNPAIWSRKLNDALWAFCTAYKTPTGTTPYKLIYGKNCHLPFEIQHCAYWALKNCNPDLIAAGKKRMF